MMSLPNLNAKRLSFKKWNAISARHDSVFRSTILHGPHPRGPVVQPCSDTQQKICLKILPAFSDAPSLTRILHPPASVGHCNDPLAIQAQQPKKVRRIGNVDVIVAVNALGAVMLKPATSTIPIVFVLVASLENRSLGSIVR